MADKPVAKVLETQVSLTEWIQRINHDEAMALAQEDNHKRTRIGQIDDIIGLPYDKPVTFEAVDVTERTPEFEAYVAEHGDELCALRLIPKAGNSDLPKLRMRGKTIRDALVWLNEQIFDPEKYTTDFVPHPPDDAWGVIMVVNNKGIYGEIYPGGHHVLTQGFHPDGAPHVFGYDFRDWYIDPPNDDALGYLQGLVEMIHVADSAKRERLTKEVQATFAHNYIKGYWEATHSKVTGTWFIDYNRILGERYSDFQVSRLLASKQSSDDDTTVVRGRIASPGQAEGIVFVTDTVIPEDQFPEGGILVCKMTSPDYLPLMQKAAAIVTDEGGILCHAAIVARELGKPCIVGTGNATTLLKTGDSVIINANEGTVAKAT